MTENGRLEEYAGVLWSGVLVKSSHILFWLNWYQWPLTLWAPHRRGPASGGLTSQSCTIKKEASSREPEHAGIQQIQIFIVLLRKLWWKTPSPAKQIVQCQHFYSLEKLYTVIIPASSRQEAEYRSFDPGVFVTQDPTQCKYANKSRQRRATRLFVVIGQ